MNTETIRQAVLQMDTISRKKLRELVRQHVIAVINEMVKQGRPSDKIAAFIVQFVEQARAWGLYSQGTLPTDTARSIVRTIPVNKQRMEVYYATKRLHHK